MSTWLSPVLTSVDPVTSRTSWTTSAAATTRAITAFRQRDSRSVRPVAVGLGAGRPRRTAAAGPARSVDDLATRAALAERLEGLAEDRRGLVVAAALLHVGEVRLVRLNLGRGRRVLRVEVRRHPAAGAVPDLRDRGVRGEGRPCLVPGGAEVGDV